MTEIIQLSTRRSQREAVTARDFMAYAQPIIDLRSTSIAGLEFLARERSPEGKLLTPQLFLPFMRGSIELAGLDLFMARSLCRVHRDIGSLISPDLSLHLNLGVETLRDFRFVRAIGDCMLMHSGLIEHLVIEVIEDPELGPEELAHLGYLREMGARVAIDDFGAGFSNYGRLAKFPFDSIKLDKSLVDGLVDSTRSRSIVLSILSLASEFGITVVAEGVESKAQGDCLRDLGCPLAQGFFWYRPMAVDHLVERLSIPPCHVGLANVTNIAGLGNVEEARNL